MTRALLLAGGAGTRLRPITWTVPKCLVPIDGRALIDHWLDNLFGNGIERVLVNTHWLAGQVKAHIAASPWAPRVDIVHEPELLGTAGTILANRDYFGRSPFLVAHADNLSSFDPKALIDAHAGRPPGVELTMLAFRSDDPRSCGILEVDDQNIVVGFHEKVDNPPGNLANGAVYVVEPRVLDFISALGKRHVDLSTEVLPAHVGRMQVYLNARYHRDIGTPRSLALARQEFRALARG